MRLGTMSPADLAATEQYERTRIAATSLYYSMLPSEEAFYGCLFSPGTITSRHGPKLNQWYGS